MKDEVIVLWKPKRVSKSLWEYRVRKWAEDAQGEQVSQVYSRRKKWDKGAHKQCNGLRQPKIA